MDRCLFDYGYAPGDWYQDENVGGIVLSDGRLEVVEEYGSDYELARYDIEVMNGLGYYDLEGNYVPYQIYED